MTDLRVGQIGHGLERPHFRGPAQLLFMTTHHWLKIYETANIGVARGGGQRNLDNIVILCFERRFSKQNTVIRLKSNILPTPNFWAGNATDCEEA